MCRFDLKKRAMSTGLARATADKGALNRRPMSRRPKRHRNPVRVMRATCATCERGCACRACRRRTPTNFHFFSETLGHWDGDSR